MTLTELRELTGGRAGVHDVACPLCGPLRHSPANRTRRVLRIWDDGELVTFKCARCDEHGWARGAHNRNARAERPAPLPKQDKAETARALWRRSVPAPGSLAETYLRGRRCWFDSPSIRFLPARGRFPPAMIARFGTDDAITGIHLTRLQVDGTGKAGTETDKLMIGPTLGQPIVVSDNIEREELIITEGIEDAASYAVATGWSAWAAGAAGRIPACLTQARHIKIYVAMDDDKAGRRALEQARAVRPDLLPINCAKLFGRQLDANRIIMRYGVDVLLCSIEWTELQNECAAGRISVSQMQSGLDRINIMLARSLPD